MMEWHLFDKNPGFMATSNYFITLKFMFDNITVLRYTEEAQVNVSEVHCLSHLDQVRRSHGQGTGATFEVPVTL